MKDDEFEWDDNKARANERKHGVSFEVPRRCFNDNNAITRPDDRESYSEDRFAMIAESGKGLLVVVYSRRNGSIRIISSRRAEPHESRRYHSARPPGRR